MCLLVSFIFFNFNKKSGICGCGGVSELISHPKYPGNKFVLFPAYLSEKFFLHRLRVFTELQSSCLSLSLFSLLFLSNLSLKTSPVVSQASTLCLGARQGPQSRRWGRFSRLFRR